MTAKTFSNTQIRISLILTLQHQVLSNFKCNFTESFAFNSFEKIYFYFVVLNARKFRTGPLVGPPRRPATGPPHEGIGLNSPPKFMDC